MSRARDRAEHAGHTYEDAMHAGEFDAIDEGFAAIEAEMAETIRQEQDAWRSHWPKHCTACRGWGGTGYIERHGFTHGGGEPMVDPCEALPPTTCHRCGAEGLTEDGEGPCTACGWDYDDGEPD